MIMDGEAKSEDGILAGAFWWNADRNDGRRDEASNRNSVSWLLIIGKELRLQCNPN